MMADIYYFIITQTAPLYRVLYQNAVFFIDLWSFVHFINSFLLMVFLLKIKTSRPFMTLITILFIYECVELAFPYLAVDIFRPEIIPDQITDILVGISGGFLGWRCYGLHWQEKKFSASGPGSLLEINIRQRQ